MNMWEQCLLGQPRDRTTGKWEFDLIEGYRRVKKSIFKKRVYLHNKKTKYHIFSHIYCRLSLLTCLHLIY